MHGYLCALALMFLVLCGAGCQKSDDAERRSSTPTGISAPAHIQPGSLAIEIVNELNENLVHRTSLTPEQARAVAVKAAGALEIAKTDLMLAGDVAAEGYEDRIESFADELIKGALDALDELKDVHQRQVNKVLEEIITSVVESMEGRTDHLDTKGLCAMLKVMGEGAMHYLDEAGFTAQSMAEGARTIAATAIASLDDAGVLTSANGKDILIAIVSGALQGLADGPMGSSTAKHVDYATVIDDLLYGAVGSLDDAGFSLDEIDDNLAHILFAAVSTLDEIGLKPEELELAIAGALHGAMDALKREAGISDPVQLEDALGFCVSGAVASLAQSQMTVDQMDEVIAVIVKKTVMHVDNLGVSEAATETVIEEIVLAAIGALDDAGFFLERSEAYGDVMADITVAAMEGLADVGFTNAEIEVLLDDITASAFKPLVDHGFTKAQGEVIGAHFRTRLEAILAASQEIVFPYDDAEIRAHVQAAIDAAYGPS
jgi:hypothetical protein